ncbi:hypothetical protein NQ317_003345, partial [Molorchus minor]
MKLKTDKANKTRLTIHRLIRRPIVVINGQFRALNQSIKRFKTRFIPSLFARPINKPKLSTLNMSPA